MNAVGIREIARELGLSPGNVSYHFATKEDLVLALLEEMHSANNAATNRSGGPIDFVTVDALIRDVMRRDLENVWLMRDVVGLITVLPALRPVAQRMHHARHARVDRIVAQLVAANLLDAKRIEPSLHDLRLQIVTQLLFWIPSAIVAAPDRDPGERLDDHARAALALFLPHCTWVGKRQLDQLLAPAQPLPRAR